jgi:GTPase SAR1 family protein
MRLTHSELEEIHYGKDKDGVFTFGKDTMDIVSISLSENENLERIVFESAQPNLKCIDAGFCNIKEIIFSHPCRNLEAVYLNHNQLANFEVGVELPALELLDLSFNKPLTELKIMGDLKKLNCLYLRDCNLKDLTVFADQFKSPEFDFNIEKNEDMQAPAVEIVQQGKKAVQAWFSELGKGTAPNDELKVVMLGNSAAGKSSLFRYLKDEVYKPGNITTHGIEVNDWMITKKEFPFVWESSTGLKGLDQFTAHFWDFGGQEFYHATHRLFLKENAVYLVVWEFDTNLYGFKPTKLSVYRNGCELIETRLLEHFNYGYWLQTVRHFAKNSLTWLVQNKTDLHGIQPDDSNVGSRYGVSPNKTGHISIERASETGYSGRFNDFKDNFLPDLARYVGAPMPIYWQKVRSGLRTNFANRNMVKYSEYEAFCRSIDPNIKLTELSTYLDQIGNIVYYPEYQILNEYVFINPRYLTETIYKILDYGIEEDNCGEFGAEEVDRVLNDIANENKDADLWIRLMKAFELIFEKTPGNFVAPQYLPQSPIDDKLKGKKRKNDESLFNNTIEGLKNPLARVVYSGYLPRCLMVRFISTYGPYANDENYWKHGIVFNKYGLRVYVRYDHKNSGAEDHTIEVCVEPGKNPFAEYVLYKDILRTFNRINENQQDVSVEVSDGNLFVPLAELKKQQQTGHPTFLYKNRNIDIQNYSNFMDPTHKDTIEQLLSNGDLSRAIHELLAGTRASGQTGLHGQVLVQSGLNIKNEEDNKQATIGIDDYRRNLERINYEVQTCLNDYLPAEKPKGQMVERKDIFISYSHHPEDQPYFDQIKRQLKSLKGYGLDVKVWDDTMIKTGDQWMEDITKALNATRIGVLLVSQNFLGSDFILHEEIPVLLEAVEKDGGKIMPIILRQTPIKFHPVLKHYQAANPPEKPLNTLTEPERDAVYAKLLEDILAFYGIK